MIPYHNQYHTTELWDKMDREQLHRDMTNQIAHDTSAPSGGQAIPPAASEGVIGLRHGSPHFYRLLERMAQIHDMKSHDYASQENPYGNYHFAGMLSKLFDNPDDAGFIGRIGEKLFRLANLENAGKTPRNESIDDTEVDICTIITLWMASRRDRRWNPSKKPTVPSDQFLDLVTLMPDKQLDELIDYARQLRLSRNIRNEGKQLDTRKDVDPRRV